MPMRSSEKIVVLCASSMTVLAGAILSPGLPGIRDAFAQAANVDLLTRLVLTTPAIVIATTASLSGWLSDRIGRRPVFTGALLLYAAAGSAGLWIDSLAALLVSRALLGLAMGGVMTAATALIADFMSGNERRAFMGAQGAFMALGGVVYVLAGGALANLHWRAPFAVYLAAAPLALAGLAVLRKPEPRAERLAGDPALRRELIPWRPVAAILPTALCGMIVFYLIPVNVAFYLRALYGATPFEAGTAISFSSVAAAAAASQYGRLRRLLSPRVLCALLFALMGAAHLMLSQAEGRIDVFAAMAVNGLGFGLMMPNLNVWISERAPVRMRGRLIGSLAACGFLGQFLSPVVSAPVAARGGLGGFDGVYGFGGALAFAVAAAYLAGSLWLRMRAREAPSARSGVPENRCGPSPGELDSR